MHDDAPPPGLRGKPLLLARSAALTVSIGALVLLMARAGGGCRSADPAAAPEPRTAVPTATAPASATASAAAPAVSASARPQHFFPGSKSMGGGFIEPSQGQK